MMYKQPAQCGKSPSLRIPWVGQGDALVASRTICVTVSTLLYKVLLVLDSVRLSCRIANS